MLTNEEMLMEYTKCLIDPIYAIETYLKTFDKTQEGFVKFQLFPKQKEIVTQYKDHKYNLITKPRQAGISTTTQAFAAIRCAFADPNNPETIVVIANKLTLAKKFVKGIKDFVNQLPRWIWGEEYYGSKENLKRKITLTDSQVAIELVNGSKIIAVATSVDALRGYAPTYLIFDEAAFIDKGDELYAAAITSLATGGRAILISTPNGYDKLYYTTYYESTKGKNDYNVIEMKWYQDPRYNKDLRWKKGKDAKSIEEPEIEFTHESFDKRIRAGWKPTSTWYEESCRKMNNDKRKIAQELDVSFLGSGGNVIDEEWILMQELENVEEPQIIDDTFFNGVDGHTWIWRLPEEGKKYILSADVSRGDGADASTIQIVDFDTMEQVLEYQGKIQPDLFANIIYHYGMKYNAYVVVDNINLGSTTVYKLLEMKYPNLHYDDSTPKTLSKASYQFDASIDDKYPGFNINGVRLQLIANFEEHVRLNIIKIRSKRLINEMRTFVYKGAQGRPDHQEGFHDDLLIAMGMALWVLQTSFKNLKKTTEQTKVMLNSWKMSSVDIMETSSGFVPKNNKNVKATPKPKFSPLVSKNMQDPTGKHSWLFSGMR